MTAENLDGLPDVLAPRQGASMRPRPMTAENLQTFRHLSPPCCCRFNEAAADDRGKPNCRRTLRKCASRLQ